MGCDIHLWVESREQKDGRWRLAEPEWVCPSCDGAGVVTNREDEERQCYLCKGLKRVTCFQDRNYTLFAVLAGVRNGRGTAPNPYRSLMGLRTYVEVDDDPVTPIAEPRGFPSNLSKNLSAYFARVLDPEYEDSTPYDQRIPGRELAWPGEHSDSWLLLSEIESYFETPRTLLQRGLVPLACWSEDFGERFYKRQQGPGPQPAMSYCHGISNGEVISMEEARIRLADPACQENLAEQRLHVGPLLFGAPYVKAEWTIDLRKVIGEHFLVSFLGACRALARRADDVRLVFNFDS